MLPDNSKLAASCQNLDYFLARSCGEHRKTRNREDDRYIGNRKL